MSAPVQQWSATVDQLGEQSVLLDADGIPVRLPRAWFPENVREGDGFVLSLQPAPEVSAQLRSSVEERLQALRTAETKKTP